MPCICYTKIRSAIGNIFQLPTKPNSMLSVVIFIFISPLSGAHNTAPAFVHFSFSRRRLCRCRCRCRCLLLHHRLVSNFFVCFKLSLPIVYELFVAVNFIACDMDDHQLVWFVYSLHLRGERVHCCAHHQHRTTEFWKQSVGHKIRLSADVFQTLFHPLMK